MTRWKELGMTAEEYVRSRWKTPVMLRDSTTEDKGFGLLLLRDSTTEDKGFGLLLGSRGIWPCTEDWSVVWLAAATFIAEHEEAIRQKREEIATMSEYAEASLSMAESGIENGDSFIAGVGAKGLYAECRILAVLEGQLEGMLKGWKG